MKPLLSFSPLAVLVSLAACVTIVSGQSSNGGDNSFGTPTRQLPPQFEARAKELRAAPPNQYDFSKSNMGDVLRFLATDAKISFFSLPEDSPESGRIITFSINGSPFSVLETLCKANGLSLIPDDNGNWYIRPADDRELIGHSYQIKNNAMEKVENKNELSGGGGGGGTIQSASVDLQGARDSFNVLPSELIKDIRVILDLPPEDANGNSVGGGLAAPLPVAPGGAAGTQPNSLASSNDLSSAHQPKVIWKSDSNTLYIVATRLQHLWVEGYLAAADKPQSLIAVEVKFIETSKDPTKELGLDWSGTLGSSGTFRQTKGKKWDATSGSWIIDQEMLPNKEGGYRTDLTHLSNVLNLGDAHGNRDYGFLQKDGVFTTNSKAKDGTLNTPLMSTLMGYNPGAWPAAAVLSGTDLNVRLRALLTDQDTQTVSYPRMVTLNNHEVVIRSVVNQPVLDGTSAISGGGGSAAVSSKITYLPIGTVLNILPKRMDGDRVLLNIKVTVSSILGEQMIAGNPYPVATSRVYNAPVEVNDGYTVAIGGLDEAKEQNKETGVPILGKIPGLGYLFKTKSRAKNHKNLMMFITPMIIDAKGGGLSEEPVSVVPRRPENEPRKPQVDAQGALAGGVESVPESIKYLSRECDIIQATISEGRSTDKDSRKLTEMKMALNKLDEQVATLTTQHPDKAEILTKASIDLAGLHERVSKMKREILKKAYY